MIRIAIVGEIGSGKSYVSQALGLPVFNADKEVSKIYNNNKKIYLKLKKKFPTFIKSYPIKKEELLKVIIKNKKNIKIISKLVHPIVRRRMNRFLKKNNKKRAIVLDIPLYFENKIYKKKDIVIYVSAKKSQVIKKLKLRNGFNFKLYSQLKKIQLSNEQKRKRSNFIVKNNFNKTSLKKEINMIRLKILKK
tara:strand:+ start:442 stop:1017 length:576 start_codon:yes stop_codon:yes gene_type:complete